jgi:hypothetical protein
MSEWGKVPKHLRRLIESYVRARINDGWKGNVEPSQWPSIEFAVVRAKERLAKELLSALKG